MTAQCEGMGEVGSARYEPALLPPYPSIRVLSHSNCQEIHSTPADGPGSVSVNGYEFYLTYIIVVNVRFCHFLIVITFSEIINVSLILYYFCCKIYLP